MKISLGITDLTPAWQTVIEQIGIPYVKVEKSEDLKFTPILLLNNPKSKITKNAIAEFINEGGSILTEASIAEIYFGYKTKSKSITFFEVHYPEIFSNKFICDLYLTTKVASNSNCCESNIYAGNIGKGRIIVLPDGFADSIFDNRTVRKNFHPKFGEWFPNERVARVSKSEISLVIKKSLQHLFHSAGLPFIHLWNFPHGKKTIFNFRIDTDFGSEKDVFDLYKILNEHNIPGTWFIETKSKEKWLKRFNEFQNQELAYHCYRHRMTEKKSENEKDFEEGLKLLQKNDIIVSGYAAPYGEWNVNIGELSEKFGFEYSSEFGYAHDGLPFYPYAENKKSNVLQIPIHPMSTNRLKHSGTKSEDLIKYFIDVIKRKIYNEEPLFFYTHPFEKEYEFFNQLFEEINKRSIHKITLKEFSNWWKKRTQLNWQVEDNNGRLQLLTDNVDDSYFVKVSEPGGKTYLAPLTNGIVPAEKKYLENDLPNEENINYNELRKYNFKMFKHDILFNLRKLQQ